LGIVSSFFVPLDTDFVIGVRSMGRILAAAKKFVSKQKGNQTVAPGITHLRGIEENKTILISPDARPIHVPKMGARRLLPPSGA
jgi:hypothetical protein